VVKFPFRLANSQSAAGTVQTIPGVSRIHAATTVETVAGKSKIHAISTVETLPGVSNIHATSNVAAISGKSNLKVKSNLDLGPLQSTGFDIGPLQSPPIITTIHPIPGISFVHANKTVRPLDGISFIHPNKSVETLSGVSHLVAPGLIVKSVSGISSILADTIPPTSPGSLSRSQSGACVTLTWTAATASTFISSYTIWRCSGVGCAILSPIATVTGSTLTYTDCSVTSGSYTYQVTAANGSGVPGPPSTGTTIIVALTTVVTLSGVSNIHGGATKTISGVSNITSAIPSLGARVSQELLIVTRHPTQAGDGSGNSVNVSQALAIVTKHPTQLDVRVSQVVLIVRVPYVPRVCWGYSSDNYGLGGAPL
jgi:hypothetical protein